MPLQKLALSVSGGVEEISHGDAGLFLEASSHLWDRIALGKRHVHRERRTRHKELIQRLHVTDTLERIAPLAQRTAAFQPPVPAESLRTGRHAKREDLLTERCHTIPGTYVDIGGWPFDGHDVDESQPPARPGDHCDGQQDADDARSLDSHAVP